MSQPAEDMLGESSQRPSSTYLRIKHDIAMGALPPGTPLLELLLAERYSVSRTPVREALRRLEQDDLVERVGRTMRVREHSLEEVFELYEVRAILETAAAQAAAERRTEADLARLRDLVARMDDSELSVESRVQLNWEFHAAIWRASHNSVLADTLERHYTSSVRYTNTTLASKDRWTEALAEHRQMIEAIIERDQHAVVDVMEEHLRIARDIRIGVSRGAADRRGGGT